MSIPLSPGDARVRDPLVFAMACRRCGCRMLTKVGRTKPMLICTDCGLPVDQRETAAQRNKRLWGGITLVGMTVLGGLMFSLASMREMGSAGRLEGSDERQGEGPKEESGGEGGSLLPSGALVDLLHLEPERDRTAPRPPKREPVKGATGPLSAKPGAVPQEQKEP